MANVKMTEVEAQYQRINIFKGKHNRLIFYRPLLKKAYQVTKEDVKEIQRSEERRGRKECRSRWSPDH